MPTLLAMLRMSRLLSHITRVCTTLTFSSAVTSLGLPDGPSSSTLSLPLQSSAAHFFHCALGRLLSEGFLEVFMNFLGRHSFLTEVLNGAQWLNGRLLDLRSKGRRFEPHRRHWVVSLSKNINPSLVLVQPRKTCPFITERLLMGRKESNQTNKQKYLIISLISSFSPRPPLLKVLYISNQA